MTTFFARIDRSLIVRFQSVFGEVMTKYAHLKSFRWFQLMGVFGVVFEIVLF